MLFEEFRIEDFGDVRYQDGLQAGLQEGLQAGLLQKAIEVAKKLLSLSMPVETVAEFVGLPIEKIKELAGE